MSSGPEVLRCSEAAEARGDQLGATAPPAQRLVLVEQAGPWGRDAVRESELAKAVATDLLRRAMEVNARVLLIRRPGRPWPSDGTRQWAVVDTRPGSEATWWGSFAEERELLDVPLDGTGGERSDALTYLVCTHGRHDVCCAIRGRPVAAAFAACRPQQTWECSHVGGDRFAANVVVAPYGLYYGHVPPAEVLGLVRANESGVVTPTLLRGRTAFSSPVQAAMHHARAALGELRINGIDLVAEAPATQGTHRHRDSWHVRLGHDSGLIDVVVRASSKAVDGRLTCAAVDQGHIRSFDLVSLTLPPAATAPRGQN